MNIIVRTLLVGAILAMSLVAVAPRSVQADDYWTNHWSWYDNTYQPYYYRSYRYSPGYSSYAPAPSYYAPAYAPGYYSPGYGYGSAPYRSYYGAPGMGYGRATAAVRQSTPAQSRSAGGNGREGEAPAEPSN